MMPSPTRLGRKPLPKVTGANCHQDKYEVNNSKVSSLSLPGYLQSSLPCLINVSNHAYQTQTKGLYNPRKINIGIQFAPQLFSTVPSPTRLDRQPLPTVTCANRHQKKYEVNNPKVSILLLNV